jgi:NADH:ubiquinone oxidoreductase subunit 5 (subunit L)/multisubunit Na+/H+ antiporter MnhA subunit
LGTISAFFTAFYSFRLLYLTFLTEPNAPISSYSMLPNIVNNNKSESNPGAVGGGGAEAPANMAVPLVILGFGSIFVG